MALEKFTLAALAAMDDGRLAVAWQQGLDKLRLDCEDRASVKAARKLVLVVEMTPQALENGELDSVDVDVDIDDRLPKRRSKTYNMRATQGALLYNEASPEEVRQRTLDMLGERQPKPVTGKDAAAGSGKEVADAR